MSNVPFQNAQQNIMQSNNIRILKVTVTLTFFQQNKGISIKRN
ncbi:MAG: hypothetical protein OXE78_14735 [Gammaproteobacteria bacterium]|nr:hypothetical protein [Gammaproteobacteria bacterium]